MKGHTLPGINQRGNGSQDDGRAKSSAFQKSPFKNYKKGYYGEGDSPMKNYKKGYYGEGSAFTKLDDKDGLQTAKKKTGTKPTDREIQIKQNQEFNKYAEEQGWKPNLDSVGVKKYEEFYSNKDNVNFLNKKQKEYFANKKK
tara:strand:+ start:1575 stop:2000 length:426 start_codon:yes stop_codon:yes gene_type:complete